MTRRWWTAALGAAAGCAGSTAATAPADEGVFAGFCEASAVIVADGRVLVGDNEADDRLFTFDEHLVPGEPTRLSPPVEDIEALLLTPGGLAVVGSQSANKDGEPQPERERVRLADGRIVRPDLTGCSPCEAARGRPPKRGGLSIEGAAYWNDAVWLGVRSPVVDGSALLLRMTDTWTVAEVVPVALDGLGVRDLTVEGGRLWIAAGPSDDRGGPHRLYALDAPGAAARASIALPDGTEGITRVGGAWLTVQDGDGKPGKPCASPARWKRLASPQPAGPPG